MGGGQRDYTDGPAQREESRGAASQRRKGSGGDRRSPQRSPAGHRKARRSQHRSEGRRRNLRPSSHWRRVLEGMAQGKLVETDDVPEKGLPRYAWWVQIKTSSGAVGWTVSRGNFANQDACG